MTGSRTVAMSAGLLALLLASACGQPQAGGNAVLAVNAAVDATVARPDNCAPPELVLAETSAGLSANIVAATKANFATALSRACAKGQLDKGSWLAPEAVDPGRLFLFNAPDANVASIYMSEANANRMVLEYPFLTADGQSRVPTAEELEEAIYCNVVGATPEEEEKDGRCLPD